MDQATIKPSESKLTEKQIRFCQEYIIDLNGQQAAIRAGYSENSAAESASENLNKSNVQQYVQELLDDRAARTQATADKVISELYHLISFDPSEVFNEDGSLKAISSIPKNIRKAISNIEICEEFAGVGERRTLIGYTKKIKFWDKTKAIDMLAKHLVLFKDENVTNINVHNSILNKVGTNGSFSGEDRDLQNRIRRELFPELYQE